VIGALWILGGLYAWALEPATEPEEPEEPGPELSTSTDLEPVSAAREG
jgi:hypothetical protein